MYVYFISFTVAHCVTAVVASLMSQTDFYLVWQTVDLCLPSNQAIQRLSNQKTKMVGSQLIVQCAYMFTQVHIKVHNLS